MDIYRDVLLDHYHHAQNRGLLPTGTQYTEHNPLCGDTITMQIQVAEDCVADARFDGTGCVISIASGSLLTEYVKGKDIESVERLTLHTIEELLGLSLPPARISCALLALHALHGALR